MGAFVKGRMEQECGSVKRKNGEKTGRKADRRQGCGAQLYHKPPPLPVVERCAAYCNKRQGQRKSRQAMGCGAKPHHLPIPPPWGGGQGVGQAAGCSQLTGPRRRSGGTSTPRNNKSVCERNSILHRRFAKSRNQICSKKGSPSSLQSTSSSLNRSGNGLAIIYFMISSIRTLS